jgi:hypothetical protein
MSEGNESERARLIAWLEGKIRKAPIASVLANHHGRTVDRFEIDPGEATEAFGARLWHDLEADASALGGEGPETYMVLLFREGAEGPEATRPLRVHPLDGGDPAHFGGDNDRAQSFRHSERYAQIMAQMSATALDRADRENDRLIARQAREDDRRWEDLERARRVALDQSELELKKEEARTQLLFMEKAFEQLELLAPLILSKVLGSDESPGGAVERRMLKEFLGTLGDHERTMIFSMLDGVQRIALGSLAQGELDPKFEAIAIQRLMASVTEEQLRGIYEVCQGPEQRMAFERIFDQRKKGLAYAKQVAKLASAPKEPPPNGSAS